MLRKEESNLNLLCSSTFSEVKEEEEELLYVTEGH